MASIQLSNAHMHRVYQLECELNVPNTPAGCVYYNSQIIYNWAYEKCHSVFNMREYLSDFSHSFAGYELYIIYDKDNPFFTLKLTHPDNQVAGRVWITEAEIIYDETMDRPRIGVKLSYSDTQESEPLSPDGFSVPQFVSTLIYKKCLIDVIPLSAETWVIRDYHDLITLRKLIESPNRKLPVIVNTEFSSPFFIDSFDSNTSLNLTELARKASPYSHVVYMSSELTEEWIEEVGEKWAAFNGAVRTYNVGLDFNSNDYFDHPLALPSRILSSTYEPELEGPDAYLQILLNNIKFINSKVRYFWRDLGYKFYYQANREKQLKLIKAHSEEEKNNSVDELSEYINMFDEENELLKSQKESLTEENKRLEQEIKKLKGQIRSLTEWNLQLQNANHVEIPSPTSYSEIEDWINTYYAGRLILHSRAVRALKDAVYQDLPLVCKALDFLGNSYYNLRVGNIDKAQYDDELQALKLEESRSISEVGLGGYEDVYTVIYERKKVVLDRHLKKGTSRDPRECLRIYFTWLDDENLVLIGSLPAHLETSAS